MGTVRQCIAAIACAALLSIAGTTAAGAAAPPKCGHLAKLTERLEAKEARIAARSSKPRPAKVQEHQRGDPLAKVQARIAELQTLCSG